MSIFDPPSVPSETFGKKNEEAASSDTGSFSLISLFKRLLTYMSGGATVKGAENPRYSEAGVLPVVPEQTYWERMRKHGRTAYKLTLPNAYTTDLGYTQDMNPRTVGEMFIPMSISIGVTTDAMVYLVFRPDSSFDVFQPTLNSSYEYLWAGYLKAGESFTYYPDGLVALRPSGELRWQIQGLTEAGKYTQCAAGAMVATDD